MASTNLQRKFATQGCCGDAAGITNEYVYIYICMYR